MTWPREIVLVRHGQSAGNVARDLAIASALPTIEITGRDHDVPLSRLGEQQSRALGEWMRDEIGMPDAVATSPYVRARATADIALAAAGWQLPSTIRADERLREKEFGILDRLTRFGIEQKYPDQVTARSALGKFYYRPPGGESWVDVILRVRSFVETLQREYSGLRVLVVSHQVVVLCLRYVLEDLDELELLAIDRAGDVANCGVTRYVHDPAAGAMQLLCYNSVAPLAEEGAPVTSEPDAASGIK
jgi:probable phosphoglycerate mutase